MSSLLNKNHPFRASITHDTPAAPGAGGTEQAAAPPKEEKADSLKSFKLKAKIGTALLAVGTITYLWLQAYDEIFTSSKPEVEEGPPSVAQDVEEDWMYQGDQRDVENARESAGIFGRLFCRGGRRSTFCD